MLYELFAQIIPLTAALALPFPVIKSIRCLLGGRPIAHSVLFIVTWGITCFLVLTTAVYLNVFFKDLVGGVTSVTLTDSPDKYTGLMHITTGLFFISIGVRRLRSAVENKKGPVPQHAIELNPSSIIKHTLKIELFKLKNILLLLLIIYLLSRSELGFEHSLIASAMISFTAMIWVSMPLFVYFLAGKNRTRILEQLKNWLMMNVDSLGIFIFLFIGVSTLSAGLGEIIPKLLGGLYHLIAG